MSSGKRLDFGDIWQPIRDGTPFARALYERHYSCHVYKDGRRPKKFVGPGEYIALTTADEKCLFVWRKFIDASGQTGVNCAVFRVEGERKEKASEMILAAEQIARKRWPDERFYTYVDEKKIRRKRDPGRCFRRAGWKPCGRTKVNKLLILEKLP